MEYFAYSAIQWFFISLFFYYSIAEEAVNQSNNTNNQRTMKKLFIFYSSLAQFHLWAVQKLKLL